MNEHRYILEPYKGIKTKYHCPSCEKNKKFTRYINTETNEYLHNTVGRCDRSHNCGYHYTPKQYFSDNKCLLATPPQPYNFKRKTFVAIKEVNTSFIPVETFKSCLGKDLRSNHFVKFLAALFGFEVTTELISRYFIATSKHWNGATVFWQIDTQGNVRTGKIMLYSPTTGKRIKEPFNHIGWVHKALKLPAFELRQCLFGEHLLIDKTKPIAIVESEKTAIIASAYLPQFIWLAVGSLTNLNGEKCSILKGRTVTLFPDLNGFDKWSNKAKELSHLAIFTVSDLLERKATESERKQGLDLADYLIKYDYKAFVLPEPESTEPPPTGQTLVDVKPFEQPEQPKPENWEQDITELENYFAGIELPSQLVKLNPHSSLTDVSLFIESHFATLKANNGKRIYLPYLNRLKELKQNHNLIDNSNEKQ